MDPKPDSRWQAIYQRAIGAIVVTIALVIVFAAFACVWRFLDLYEVSVKASTVQARVAMEEHQALMAAMNAQRSQFKSADDFRSSMHQQTQEVPSDIKVPVVRPGPLAAAP